MFEFKPTEIKHIKHLRISYFYEIKLSQELFLEWMIREAEAFKIYNDNHEVGYFIVNKEGILLEFYLITEILYKKEEIFKQLIENHSVKKIYCKSFDNVLLTCSHTFCTSNKVIGTLFRDYSKGISVEYENQFKVRLARHSDIQFLLAYDSGLYESPEELRYTVANNMLYMFEKDNYLIGCGYLIKIMPDKNFHDIGVWTNPDVRKQGYGAMIISYLKRHCFSHNYTPVCGCDVNNIASRKTLERNGFISKYCLIEFNL